MARIAVCPFSTRSIGARKLAEVLRVPIISPDSVFGFDGTIINWGAGELPRTRATVLNTGEAVMTCVDKRFLFRLPNTFSRPVHTEVAEEALMWLERGRTVVARTRVSSCDGNGLIIVEPREGCRPQEFPRALLYTEFIPSSSEWRTHVFRGEIIAEQERVPKSDWQGERDSRVRTTNNGFGFNIRRVPEAVREESIKCFREFKLDFGALDILYNSETEKAYVLEINSAPEMTPTLLEKYSQAFRRVINFDDTVSTT